MNAFGRAVAAAAVPALVSAVITRVLMRVVTLLVNGEPHFSAAGSIGIAAFYTLAMLPGCLALAFSRSWWPWLLVAAGGLFLLVEAVAIGLDETSAAHGMTPLRWMGLVGVLVVMLAVYTAQALVSARWARHGVASVARRSSPDPGLAAPAP
jgi:hypothetical protein